MNFRTPKKRPSISDRYINMILVFNFAFLAYVISIIINLDDVGLNTCGLKSKDNGKAEVDGFKNSLKVHL